MAEGFFFPNANPEQEALARRQALADAMMARGMGPVGNSPGAGFAHAGSALAGALLAKRLGDKQKDLETQREGSYSKALGNFLSPFDYGGAPGADGIPDNVNVSPQASAANAGQLGSSMGSRLAATGNQDLQRQLSPQILAQGLQAEAPLTPYEKANLADRADQRSYERNQAEFAGLDAGSDAIQKAMNDSFTVRKSEGAAAAAGMKSSAESAAKFDDEAKLAKIKADAAAQSQGEFGRSMNGKSYNILAAGLTNDAARGTPEYATAWQILSNPHVDPNTGTIVTPDLSAFKPPTGGSAGQPQGQPPGAPPPQRMPSVQAFAPPNPSQAAAQSAGFANRLDVSNKVFDDPAVSAAFMNPANKTSASIPLVGNYLVGKDFQQADQAQRNFINAQLRRESGAVISDEEFDNARKQYFPQPGDGADVLRQKKANRDMAVRNMQLSAGNTLMPPGVIQQSSPAKGSPVVPMDQGFGAAPVASPAAHPASVPPGSLYSPSRKQYRTPDGKILDQNGNPVQ